jgi:broad specificity phosphatase PhoE
MSNSSIEGRRKVATNVSTCGRLSIYLIRHAETDWTAEDRHNGRTDVPLSPCGKDQAKHLGKALQHLCLRRIYCSPSLRAAETARIAFPKTDIISCVDLLEWDYGNLEGKTVSQIREILPGWIPWTHGFPGGETLQHVQMRVKRFAKRFVGESGLVGLVSHGHTLRVFCAMWLGLPLEFASQLKMDPASISILEWEYGSPAIRQWNRQTDGSP